MPLRDHENVRIRRVQSIRICIVAAYAGLSATMLFARQLFGDFGAFARFYRSGYAWTLGPPLNLIWQAPLYFGFYLLGTVTCALLARELRSEHRLVVKLLQVFVFASTWSACGVSAYGPTA